MKRSNEPKSARWMTYGMCSALSAPTYLQSSRAGCWPSSWIVPICHGRPSESFDVEVDLRPVERALALADAVREPAPLERRLQHALGEVPLLLGAELVVGPRRQLALAISSTPNWS